MKDAAMIKCVSIAGSVVIVCVMMAKDGLEATTAAAAVLASLTGLGGYAISETKKAKGG